MGGFKGVRSVLGQKKNQGPQLKAWCVHTWEKQLWMTCEQRGQETVLLPTLEVF